MFMWWEDSHYGKPAIVVAIIRDKTDAIYQTGLLQKLKLLVGGAHCLSIHSEINLLFDSYEEKTNRLYTYP